ncbi:MAG: DUF2306 domain-containing protein [Burkholderiales bacterium]|nr:DUF2306 domain-containing protein [Burkholderiales bacterium]
MDHGVAALSLKTTAKVVDVSTHPDRPEKGLRILRGSAAAWCGAALIGQFIFAFYVASFYGRTAIAGRTDLWNTVMPHGHTAGAPFRNTVVALHLLFAVILLVGGAVQLLPMIRRRWPRLHRWNGRVYLLAAVTAAVAGLIMAWSHGAVGDTSQHLGSTLNAGLILFCAGMALRTALGRRFDMHRQWALRLYIAANGVWFFRIGLMLWLVVNHGPAGFDPDTFRGPTLTAFAFGQSLLPLCVLQCYFHAQQKSGRTVRALMSLAFMVITVLTLAGIGAAIMLVWRPTLHTLQGPAFALLG